MSLLYISHAHCCTEKGKVAKFEPNQAPAKCNFEKGNMARIELGRTNCTIHTLYKISEALEVKLSELTSIDQ